ncbi:phage holin family protein [Acetatifactor aquisgranensis]|uniref:phage holin family protein n=1 Tax=Acetatifactor aquisgranensis TaxID=2941233 RepID=UPI00203FFEF7|nr:phage holin family protein [Acetatifactor aquisgranensis]
MAVRLVVNEIISILEHIVDIGVKMPPFLLPLAKNMKRAAEEKADVAAKEDGDGE